MGGVSRYKYLGKVDAYYVYENKYACSLGYYLPLILNENQEESEKIGAVSLENMFLKDTSQLYRSQIVRLDKEFEYIDMSGTSIPRGEVYKNKQENEDFKTRIRINFVPNATGDAYIYLDQLVYLGKVTKGKRHAFLINYPKDAYRLMDEYSISIQNVKMEKELLEKIRQNNWKNITLKHDTVEGDIDFQEDGAMMIALAYCKDWNAYIDGMSTKVYCFNDSNMVIKTKKGKHKVTLKYVPYHYALYQGISLLFFGITLGFALLEYFMKKRKERRFLKCIEK